MAIRLVEWIVLATAVECDQKPAPTLRGSPYRVHIPFRHLGQSKHAQPKILSLAHVPQTSGDLLFVSR
jgi:hypothetical protein